MIIYILKNKLNGKSYVGQTRNMKRRISVHKASTECKYIHNAIRKYGIDNFDVETIEVSDAEANVHEINLIQRLNTLAPNGYNIQPGGEGNRTTGRIVWNKGLKNTQIPWNKGTKGVMVAWNKGIKYEAITGSKHFAAKKIVLVLPDRTEERFDCISDACRKYNLHLKQLSRVLTGHRKTHKKFSARYVEGEPLGPSA
jgi:hypothetical protein